MPRRRMWTPPIIIGGRPSAVLVLVALYSAVWIAFFAGTVAGADEAERPTPVDAADRAVERLRAYLQVDTTQPADGSAPSDAAARLLAGWLAEAGLEPRLYTSPEGHVSVHARVRADPSTPDAESPALVVTHHIDVVPTGEGWEVAPFSGRTVDERVWGRGAVDTKSLGIAQLEAIAALVARREPLARDVVYLAVADEERGGGQGTAWLLREHPELVEGVEGVLNEGGANRVAGDRVVWWGVEVVQKRPLWLRLRAEGRGGHGSMSQPDSAGHRLVRALGRLLERPPRPRVNEGALIALRGQARAAQGLDDAAVEALIGRYREAFAAGEPVARLQPSTDAWIDSLQVTQVELADSINVVAPTATAGLDIRLLPDTDAEVFLADLRETLGPGIDLETVLFAPPAPPSPREGPVWTALERALGVRGPVVPTLLPGTTDSRYYRERGIPAYGVSPFAVPSVELMGVHAPNEAIPREGFLRGVETMRRILEEYALGSAVDD